MRAGEERSRLERFLQAVDLIPIAQRWAVQGGRSRRDDRNSHQVGRADARMAATATPRQVPLVRLHRTPCAMLQDVRVPYPKASPDAAPNNRLEPTP